MNYHEYLHKLFQHYRVNIPYFMSNVWDKDFNRMFVIKSWDIEEYEKQYEFQPKDFLNGLRELYYLKFYSDKTVNNYYVGNLVNHIEGLNIPEPDNLYRRIAIILCTAGLGVIFLANFLGLDVENEKLEIESPRPFGWLVYHMNDNFSFGGLLNHIKQDINDGGFRYYEYGRFNFEEFEGLYYNELINQLEKAEECIIEIIKRRYF